MVCVSQCSPHRIERDRNKTQVQNITKIFSASLHRKKLDLDEGVLFEQAVSDAPGVLKKKRKPEEYYVK
jgi:hypothetical protein